MSGWNLRKGNLKNMAPAEEQLWQMLNFVFSSGSRKRNSYKFGLIKSILDNLLNCKEMADGELFLSYKDLFAKFTENYWNLVVKYNLRQMRPDGKSEISAIERILTAVVDSEEHRFKAELEFIDLSDEERDSVISKVSKECKKNVFGALYEDTEGFFYLTLKERESFFLQKYLISC